MYKFLMFAVLTIWAVTGAAAQTRLSGTLTRDLASVQPAAAELRAEPAVFDDAAPEVQKKSAGLAALYSLVLPGMGEMYVENFDAGKYPLIAEGALWLTYGTMQYYGTWLRNDARNFAAVHAGLATTSGSDQFYVDVSNFINTNEYNEKKLRDRAIDKVYSTPETVWQWDADANRDQFRQQRVSSDAVFNNSRFVIGALLVNRIVSAINAARLARQFNRALGDQGLGAWRIESSMLGTNGVQLALVRTF